MTNEIKPTDINWLKDGERAEAIVLNRPIENLRVATNKALSDLNSETVSQEEAEAGTSTERRAWTAQRVRQSYDAAWNESKAELLDTKNLWTQPQNILQGETSTAFGLSMDTNHNICMRFSSGVETDVPVSTYLGIRANGQLATGPDANLTHLVHTTETFRVRTPYQVRSYIGNGVTLAEDARAALELGTPTHSINANLLPGRNRNITISGNLKVTPIGGYFGTGAFASITIRSNITSPRTIILENGILNKSSFESEYTVTDTEALYLEGRYVDSGFMITFLTMYPIPPTEE